MGINLIVSPSIKDKIENTHAVKVGEVTECFLNNTDKYITDTREEHATDPPTHWFVAETNRGRTLKVIFVQRDGNIYLKSAYDANAKSIHIYRELSNH